MGIFYTIFLLHVLMIYEVVTYVFKLRSYIDQVTVLDFSLLYLRVNLMILTKDGVKYVPS